MAKPSNPVVTQSSGNVFADLGLPNAEELGAKVRGWNVGGVEADVHEDCGAEADEEIGAVSVSGNFIEAATSLSHAPGDTSRRPEERQARHQLGGSGTGHGQSWRRPVVQLHQSWRMYPRESGRG